ncbi:hypothetical protein C2E23DRAFT_871262 [Lenzites betulinus]|nr:hypothetical protein C2E23DRAFT_871262 [Lenzites betulinus]
MSSGGRTVISISSTFHPGANLLPIPADLLLMSSDGVFFYIHLTQVLGASTNCFNNILCADRSKPDGPSADDSVNSVTCVAEIASVLNVVLHSAYNISCANYVPTLDVLVAAAGALPLYGLAPKKYIAPSTSLYQLILAQAPVQPMKVYALASRHDLYELAKPVSSHLLAFPLENLTDDVASTVDARHLARAWSLTSSYLAWVSRPGSADVSPQVIGDACSSLSPHLCCPLCKRGLAVRIKDLLAQWSFAQVRLFLRSP